MSDKTLRVGAVGLRRGSGVLNALAANPHVEISALCDLEPATIAPLADSFGVPESHRFTSFDDLIASNVDAVVIATPIQFHAEQAVKALDAGKHVLSEQTQAYEVADCQAVIDAEKRSGRVYMMAENFTYFPYMHDWKQKIDSGLLGDMYYAEAAYVHEITDRLVDPATGETKWRYERPPIWYCGHLLGPLMTLLDDRVVRATGVHSGRKTHPESTAQGYLDMEVALFQTEKGSVVKIARSQVARRYPSLVWYSLYGSKGFIENGREGGWDMTVGQYFSLDQRTPAQGATPIVCQTFDPDAPAEARTGGHGTSETPMIAEFVDAIRGNRRAYIDSVRASDFTVPGLIAHESALQGGVWLDVPLLG